MFFPLGGLLEGLATDRRRWVVKGKELSRDCVFFHFPLSTKVHSIVFPVSQVIVTDGGAQGL